MKSIVICIGTGACQIAQCSLSQQADGQFSFVFIDEEKNADGEKERVASKLDELAENLSSHKDASVILLATLGGITGSKYISKVTSILKECGRKSHAVVTAPFEWEGEKRVTLALDMLDKFVEADCDIFVFMNDRITECCGQMAFAEGFAWANEKISGLIKALTTSTTDDFLKRENKDLFLHK